MESIKRRRFLAATAAATAGITTGCTGNGDGEGDGDENETADSTENGGQDGQTDGDEAGSGGGEPDGGEIRFAEAFGMGESYAFDIEPKDGEDGTLSGRVYQGNAYVEFENEQGSGEFYHVDGDEYLVTDGECLKNPGGEMAPTYDQAEPGSYESDAEEYADLQSTETTTIDGEEVYVFEVTTESSQGTETTTAWYVGVESGNLRRFENRHGVTNLYSWGDVEPVEAPDTECQDMSDIPSPGDF